MITVLLISSEKDALSGIEAFMQHHGDVEILKAGEGKDALDVLSKKTFDLVIIDENLEGMNGLEFVEKMIKVNPMSNYAAVSSLSSQDFHQASEGLGVLMQLPVKPDESHGELLFDKLKNVLKLSGE